jgi:NAD(P)-dependent dehydrogenase (short-subunit alcohol dehydrogenase family)
MSIFDKFSFRGKVAIVTGSNRGIGKAIALGFAEAGAEVAIVTRDEKKNEDTLAEMRGLGAHAIAVTANVAGRNDLDAMLATVTNELGPADVLVNNAGIGFHADALTLDDANWRRIFDTNLDAVWMASQIVGRQMVARKAGSIINSGSISGVVVNRPQWHSAYGISKAAVHPLTKSLAAECKQGSARQRDRAGLREDGNRKQGIRRLTSLLVRRSSHGAVFRVVASGRITCGASAPAWFSP